MDLKEKSMQASFAGAATACLMAIPMIIADFISSFIPQGHSGFLTGAVRAFGDPQTLVFYCSAAAVMIGVAPYSQIINKTISVMYEAVLFSLSFTIVAIFILIGLAYIPYLELGLHRTTLWVSFCSILIFYLVLLILPRSETFRKEFQPTTEENGKRLFLLVFMFAASVIIPILFLLLS